MSGHTQRQWEGKFFRCQMCCWYCRIPLTLAEATKDHMIPVSRGGSDAISNIVPACIDCNRLKGTMTEEEFQARRKQLFTTDEKVTAKSYFQELPSVESKTNFGKPAKVLALSDRDEPQLHELRRESEGGCSKGFKSWNS